MNNPLHYQISEFDCGPTTMLNAISYLFRREEIPPEIIRNIMLYSLDCYNAEGVPGKNGTSTAAMMFLSNWLNSFGRLGQLAVTCKYISGRSAAIGSGSYINDALHRGGVVVLRLYYDEWHYVLVTGEDDGRLLVFDPYYQEVPFKENDILMVKDKPSEYNRIVPFHYFNKESFSLYALGPVDTREAVLIFNEDTRLTEYSTIEYFI